MTGGWRNLQNNALKDGDHQITDNWFYLCCHFVLIKNSFWLNLAAHLGNQYYMKVLVLGCKSTGVDLDFGRMGFIQ